MVAALSERVLYESISTLMMFMFPSKRAAKVIYLLNISTKSIKKRGLFEGFLCNNQEDVIE
jgi:hypothetical protein